MTDLMDLTEIGAISEDDLRQALELRKRYFLRRRRLAERIDELEQTAHRFAESARKLHFSHAERETSDDSTYQPELPDILF